jgi:hypothetical protein
MERRSVFEVSHKLQDFFGLPSLHLVFTACQRKQQGFHIAVLVETPDLHSLSISKSGKPCSVAVG